MLKYLLKLRKLVYDEFLIMINSYGLLSSSIGKIYFTLVHMPSAIKLLPIPHIRVLKVIFILGQCDMNSSVTNLAIAILQSMFP